MEERNRGEERRGGGKIDRRLRRGVHVRKVLVGRREKRLRRRWKRKRRE